MLELFENVPGAVPGISASEMYQDDVDGLVVDVDVDVAFR